MKQNSTIRQEVLAAMRGKWLNGIAVLVIYLLLMVIISVFLRVDTAEFNSSRFFLVQFTSILVSIAIGFPLQLGFYKTFLTAVRTDNKPQVKELFSGLTRRYHRSAMGTLLLMNIYTLLWTLLLIVPGIIKSIEYAMTYYVIADEPELGCNEAIEKSMRLMKGHRWQFFKMWLGMFGWLLLGAITLGVAYLWIIPYYQAVFAKFYEEVKQ
ncbi:MAG: DUF975 family protein [Alistipes sp.]|nr:DUF975 family protein [Alistipes sp.]